MMPSPPHFSLRDSMDAMFTGQRVALSSAMGAGD
jgi:hypothetical protein